MENTDVQEQPMPTPYGSAAGAEGVAAAAQGFSRTLSGIKERVSADQAAQKEVELQNHINDAMWNPESERNAYGLETGVRKGFMFKQGQNAVDPSAVRDAIDQARANISDSLAFNPDAQRMFNVRAAGRIAAANMHIERHSGQQIQAVAVDTAKATDETAINTIGLAHGTPDDVKAVADQQVDLALGPLQHHMKFNEGLPDNAINAQIADFKSRAYGKAIQSLLDQGDGMGAAELYGKVQGQLGARAPEYEKLIRPLVMQQQAGLQSSDIIKKSYVTGTGEQYDPQKHTAVDPGSLRINEARAMYEWNQFPEGPQKQKTLDVLRERMSTLKTSHDTEQQQSFGRVVQDIEHANGGLNESSSNFQALDDEWRGKALEKSRTILRQARRDSRTANSDDRRAQSDIDQTAFYRLQEMPPEQLKGADINALFPSVSPSMAARLDVTRNKILKQVEKGDGPSFDKFKADVNAKLTDIVPPVNDAEKKRAKQIQADMNEWYLQKYDENKGTPPTWDETKAQMSKLEAGTADSGHWFTRNPKTTRLEAEKSGKQFIPAEQAQQQPTTARPAGSAAPKGGPRPSMSDRAAQLKSQGLTKDQAVKQLRQEGY